MTIQIRLAVEGDCAAINDIYNFYVVHSTCTYQTEPETMESRRVWFANHGVAHPVIVAEMVAVKSGLGYVLWDAYYVGRMDVVIADMVSIGLLGLISDRVILLIERWVLTWRRLQSFQS